MFSVRAARKAVTVLARGAQNTGFRTGRVYGSSESDTSIHPSDKSHPAGKPAAPSSSWFDKKIPARARLENPHDDEGCAEANHSLGLGTQTTGILPGKFVWGICFTPTPFSAQANRVGKLGGWAQIPPPVIPSSRPSSSSSAERGDWLTSSGHLSLVLKESLGKCPLIYIYICDPGAQNQS